jgi:hypothetical protein
LGIEAKEHGAVIEAVSYALPVKTRESVRESGGRDYQFSAGRRAGRRHVLAIPKKPLMNLYKNQCRTRFAIRVVRGTLQKCIFSIKSYIFVTLKKRQLMP